jgi:hypothetical protein
LGCGLVYRYLKRSFFEIALVPLGVVTLTSTVPDGREGETAVIEVSELTLKLVALLGPNLTAVAPAKLVPVIVTEVPPSSGPLRGDSGYQACARVPARVRLRGRSDRERHDSDQRRENHRPFAPPERPVERTTKRFISVPPRLRVRAP